MAKDKKTDNYQSGPQEETQADFSTGGSSSSNSGPLPGGVAQYPQDGSQGDQTKTQGDPRDANNNFSGTVGFDSAGMRYQYPDIPPGTHQAAQFPTEGVHPAFGPVPQTAVPNVNVDPNAKTDATGQPLAPGATVTNADGNATSATGNDIQPSPNNPGPAKGV